MTHHFKLDQIIEAYETFGRVGEATALELSRCEGLTVRRTISDTACFSSNADLEVDALKTQLKMKSKNQL